MNFVTKLIHDPNSPLRASPSSVSTRSYGSVLWNSDRDRYRSMVKRAQFAQNPIHNSVEFGPSEHRIRQHASRVRCFFIDAFEFSAIPVPILIVSELITRGTDGLDTVTANPRSPD